LLAGANRMPWLPFLLFNTAGSVLWTCVYGLGAYYLGEETNRLEAPLEIGLTVMVLVVIFGGAILLRRSEAQLAAAAERALPGPLQDPHRAQSIDC